MCSFASFASFLNIQRDGDSQEREEEADVFEERYAVRRDGDCNDAVAYMMYGFGDAKTPNPDSVELLESILIDFMVTLV